MDDALKAWLQQQLGVRPRSRHAVAGGSSHGAWRLELADGRRVFLKTNAAVALPMLEAEADGLQALAVFAPPGLQLPAVLACARVADQAVLLLSWLSFAGASSAEAWHRLGQDLARLHRTSLEQGPGPVRFGWRCDNFIGATPQPNGWCDQWGPFFADQRLGHQLRLAQTLGQPYAAAKRLLQQVRRWLEDHTPEPVLVHGDLWSGNAALLEGGAGAMYDPAVYRGDREVDLAMARLFGGFPSAFFRGYDTIWPLPAGADRRVDLYNLYHLLNHANLFGGSYRQQAQVLIDQLLD